jgi:hypothetical protein
VRPINTPSTTTTTTTIIEYKQKDNWKNFNEKATHKSELK